MTAEPNQAAQSADTSPHSAALPTALRRVILVTMLGSFMANLDSTIVNVGLRTVSVDLHAPLSEVQWLTTAYLLAMAAVIPITGWLARRFGATRLYLVAGIVFTVGSLACALAGDVGELIAFRAVQGIGGGMSLPLSQLLLVRTAGPALLPRAMSVNAAPTLLAPIIGPTVGGLLLQHAGWPWIFLVNVPIGVVTIALAAWLLARDPGQDAGPIDLPGFAYLTVGCVAITYGLAEIGNTGDLGSPQVVVACALGVVALAGFVAHALRVRAPLLDLRLYRDRDYRAASLINVCVGATVFGAIILLPLYFQIARSLDPLDTGLLLVPQGVGAAVAIWFGARFMQRWGSGGTILAGGLLTLLATVPFVTVRADTSFWLLGAVLLVRGFGIGMVVVPAATAAYRAVPPAKVPDATIQMSVGQRVGGSAAAALLAVVLQGRLAHATGPASRAAAFDTAFWWVLGITVLATVPALVLISSERRATT